MKKRRVRFGVCMLCHTHFRWTRGKKDDIYSLQYCPQCGMRFKSYQIESYLAEPV